MRIAFAILAATWGLSSAGAVLLGCSGKKPPPREPDVKQVLLADDQSLCGEPTALQEVEESSAPGAPGRSIRRVYALVGTAPHFRRLLVCREADTNYDGRKDLARTYDLRGQPLEEKSDTDYDGVLDTFITFTSGRVGRVTLDKNNDGRIDETRQYHDGVIAQVLKDTDDDGKDDTFERYREGKLERIGVDTDKSGRVSNWYLADSPEAEPERPLGPQARPAPADETPADGTEP